MAAMAANSYYFHDKFYEYGINMRVQNKMAFKCAKNHTEIGSGILKIFRQKMRAFKRSGLYFFGPPCKCYINYKRT